MRGERGAAAELERCLALRCGADYLRLADVLSAAGGYALAREYLALARERGESGARLEALARLCEQKAGPASGDAAPPVAGLVSIVIPVYNQWPFTQSCLASIARHTPEPHGVIVVDNGSADGTPERLAREFPGVHLLRLGENRGFAAACNRGAALARGEFLLFLNNDTLVTPGWLVNLKRCLASLPLAGLAGPRTNCAGSEQMMPVSYRTLAEMEEFARGFNQPDPGRWTEVERLVGFCLLVKRRVWEEVGPFDERFGPGNYEDDDYCLRVRRRGYRLILAGDTFVHHFGGVTFTGAGLDYRALLAENRETFRKKWGLRPG